MNATLLIVDDESDLIDILSRYFKTKDFIVHSATNVKEAMKILSNKNIDIILSDVDMPGISGYDFLKTLRNLPKHKNIPFILMSGKKISEIDILEGYDKGSDDYIIKPFSYHILYAKIKAILKNKTYTGKSKIKIGKVLIDEESKEVFEGKKEIKLARKEFELLVFLYKNKNRVLTKEHLLNSIWNNNYVSPHTIETHISNLRKKIKSLDKKIISVSGYGYKLKNL
jgi:DNA-binding response OmpR family regulator